jgi:4-hydroxyacetophenone monooxygenase
MNVDSSVIIILTGRCQISVHAVKRLTILARANGDILMPKEVRTDLEAVLEYADLRVLLMVLVHLTGDEKWLQPPYTPMRNIRLIPAPDAGLPSDVQNEIKKTAAKVLASPVRPIINDPGNELILRMMRVTLGEDVPEEYAPMMREEMGFVERIPKNIEIMRKACDKKNVIIVGAGVCGIALGANLKKLDIPFTILEKNNDLGGVWNSNRYPGCGVDTPNHSYSFSFGRRYSWSRYFAQREEIHDYLHDISKEYSINKNIQYETKFMSAVWDEEEEKWKVTISQNEREKIIEAHYLVTAVGQLSEPYQPNISGITCFKGQVFHSMNWPESLDVSNKTVSIIGTGATSMQLVPSICEKAKNLKIFQRTAQWARPIEGYSSNIPDAARWLLENVPYYVEWFRFNMFWRYGDGLLPLLRRDKEWVHKERSINRANDRHRAEMTEFIKRQLGDRKDLIGKCVPDYPPYAKRILLDNNWYKTLLRENVELITDEIREIVRDGIVTVDGRSHQCDLIVFATGFNVAEMASRLNIIGRNGASLSQIWQLDNPQAYLGLTVPKLPNFFCMLGPNSGPGHGGSVIFQAECQVRYIISCMNFMAAKNLSTLEVREEVNKEYNKKVDLEHEGLIWTHPGVNNYYRNKHGRVFSVSPWRFVDYWRMTHDANVADYKTTYSK